MSRIMIYAKPKKGELLFQPDKHAILSHIIYRREHSITNSMNEICEFFSFFSENYYIRSRLAYSFRNPPLAGIVKID